MTIENLEKLNNFGIFVLGSDWRIRVFDKSDENCEEAKTLDQQGAAMLTQVYLKEIWISKNDYVTTENSQVMPKDNPAIDQDLTHELYHAFYFESGLDVCTGTEGCDNGWSRNETMIDWNAKMFPKILKVRRSLGISDNF